ncbi:MAG: hypothetical protein PHG90_03010 [Clostridia bacterium]|nr:hypothetical protein [Clostridia bacterium]NCU28819.1 hypothetical protein [Candidatus Moranbacteria bacterium]
MEEKNNNQNNTPKYYVFCLTPSQKKTVRIKIAFLSIITNFYLFFSLFFGELSSVALYIFIPQFLSFLMGMISIFFVLPLYAKGEKLQKKNVEDVTKSTKGYFISKMALLVASIIGRIIIVIKTVDSYFFGLELTLLLLAILVEVFCVFEFIIISNISYAEKEIGEN